MNLNTLREFRQQVYACMERRADALFNLCDGLLSETQARSLPELSHSPFFERQWPSVYAALADGKINVEALRALCVRSLLADLPADAAVWIAVDGTSVARLEAQTSEDRGVIHLSNLPLGRQTDQYRVVVLGGGAAAGPAKQLDAAVGYPTHQQHADGHRGGHRATATAQAALWVATGDRAGRSLVWHPRDVAGLSRTGIQRADPSEKQSQALPQYPCASTSEGHHPRMVRSCKGHARRRRPSRKPSGRERMQEVG